MHTNNFTHSDQIIQSKSEYNKCPSLQEEGSMLTQKLQHIERKYPCIPYLYGVSSNVFLILIQMCMKNIVLSITPAFGIQFRALVLLTLNSCILYGSGERMGVKDGQVFLLLICRSVFSSVTFFILMTVVEFIPITLVVALYNVAPIVIFFIEAYHSGTALNVKHLALAVLSFIGILLIIKPEFLFGTMRKQYELIYLLLPLVAAVTSSYGMYFVNLLRGKASTLVCLQYLYTCQALLTGLILNFSDCSLRKALSVEFFLALMGICVFGYSIQSLVTRAMMLAKASNIMVLGYAGIVFAFIVDILVYGVEFDLVSILGILLTSVGLLSKIFL